MASDGEFFNLWGVGGWSESTRSRAYTPTRRTGEATDLWDVEHVFETSRKRAYTPTRRNGDAMMQTGTSGPSVIKYFLMEAFDTGASTWRSWTATGAPDATASQYPGQPFQFTSVSVLKSWTG